MSKQCMRHLYPMTRERKSILMVKLPLQRDSHVYQSTGAPYWPILAWQACASKNPILWKIRNKYFYWPYSNEIFYTKALQYKEYFTSIDLWRISKSSRDIQVFLDMKYRLFGQEVSKYTIVLVCVMLTSLLQTTSPPSCPVCKPLYLNQHCSGGGGGHVRPDNCSI
jgi:hypothetical protein